MCWGVFSFDLVSFSTTWFAFEGEVVEGLFIEVGHAQELVGNLVDFVEVVVSVLVLLHL